VDSTISFTRLVVSGCSAEEAGAVYSINSALSLHMCNLVNNSASPGNGGALSVYISRVYMEETRLEANVAAKDGGALYGQLCSQNIQVLTI
jgi:predicted outer membrane repeat protein